MAKSHNRFQRRPKGLEPKKKFVIACEGEKTEKIYFDVWKKIVERKFVIKPLETKDGDSSPLKVLKRLEKFLKGKSEYNAEYGDEFWIVIDRDTWDEKEISAVYDECCKKDYNFALSNPCFEIWLNAHQENPKFPKRCRDYEKELKRLLEKDYKKNDYDAEKLIENIEHAITNAEKLHIDKTEHYPKDTGTHVYLLIKKIRL